MTNLVPGTTYYFFVIPLNLYRTFSEVVDGDRKIITFTADSVPSAPSGIVITQSTSNVVLTWNNVSDPSVANPVQSYNVKFLNQAGSYVSLSNICQVAKSSCAATCTCTVPMNTLTSSLGWTIGADTKILVEVYATNAVGTSIAGTITTPSTDSISRQFVPQIAPAMSTVTTINDTKVELTLTCITGQDAGWYSGTTKYYVSYKLTSASSWTNTSSQSCGSAIQISGLAAVSSYTFAAYAENDFGFGPQTVTTSY